jgi:hypothetical protein
VVFGAEVGRQVLLGQAQRIEIGGQVAAHAIGADQQHDAIAVVGGLFQRGFVERARRLLGGLGTSTLRAMGSSARVRSSRPARR